MLNLFDSPVLQLTVMTFDAHLSVSSSHGATGWAGSNLLLSLLVLILRSTRCQLLEYEAYIDALARQKRILPRPCPSDLETSCSIL